MLVDSVELSISDLGWSARKKDSLLSSNAITLLDYEKQINLAGHITKKPQSL